MNEIEQVEGHWKGVSEIPNTSGVRMLTDDFVFKKLVLMDGITVPRSFVHFSAEVFNRLIIQQAIRVDSSTDLFQE